jgi:uncharacterized protein YecE (DUF72 family)
VAQAWIGISGWTYAPWRGVFYPVGLPHRRELEFVASRMTSVEINGSFYALQRPSSFRDWFSRSPDDFVFAVKGGRFITHMKKLADVDTPLANFFASGVLALEHKLGPLLWQLPPNLGFHPDRLAAFLERLPRTTGQAASLAEGHDDRLTHGTVTTAAVDRPLRHALEVRHPSFETPLFLDLLRDHDVGVVVADSAGRFPSFRDVTAGFVYVRLHGAEELYVSGYTPAALDEWAGRCISWLAAGLDVYVYFDNDVKVRAPFDAIGLLERVRAAG